MSLARQRQIDFYWELIFYLGSALMAGGNFLFSCEFETSPDSVTTTGTDPVPAGEVA